MTDALVGAALAAFADADFNWVRPLESVWKDPESDVPDLNATLVEGIAADFFRRTRKPDAVPVGQVVIGTAGIGKTHMVGRLRRLVWNGGGWFVLLDIVGLKDFWRSAALCFATSLAQTTADGGTQGEAVLSGVARMLGVEEHVRAAMRFPASQSLKIIDMLTGGLDRFDRMKRLQHQEVFRALYLFCCQDPQASNLAYSWLQGLDIDPAKGAEFGLASAQRSPVELVRGLSWIMGLAGPTLVAVDQIDGLVSPSSFASPRGSGGDGDDEPPLVEVLAAGLMELHEVRHRGMTVVTCLERTWDLLQARALHAAMQRFAPPRRLLAMKDADGVGRLIAGRLAGAYADAGFAPPYPTWPFSAAAVEGATSLLPRQILMRCEDHRRLCVEAGRVTVCDALLPDGGAPAALPSPPPRPGLEAAFAEARAGADLGPFLAAADDAAMGALIGDALGLYVRQTGLSNAVDIENRSDPAQKKPPLHGRLTFTFHEEGGRERHFCFRALEHANAIAFQSRLGAAMTASGIDRTLPGRHLFLLRRTPFPGGAKTALLAARFNKAGGVVIVPTDDDLRTFVGLRALRDEAAAGGTADAFEAWLRARKPLCGTSVFAAAGLCPPPGAGGGTTPPPAVPAPPAPADTTPKAGSDTVSVSTGDDRAIPIGWRVGRDGEAVTLPVSLLPRHTAVIAGSGSGKTVLVRRMIEEAALLGIPSIVLDPNNDLARLGDPWPQRPPGFTDEDDAKARRLRDAVEVVVWTPGRRLGNPLFLPVLPDFAALGDDPDEREQAVGMAVDTLGPLAGLKGVKGPLKQGVLTEALRHFARVFGARRGGDLSGFIAYLGELPEGVSTIDDAERLAADMANNLKAAMATNPLLKADGPVLDPERMFGGGERTRVSVVNLSGLGSEAAKHDFVNRLQMTLFGWIKAHPSPTGRLYVIDEAQDFVPSQVTTPCRNSAVRLVAQARKYGLGMVLATQMPRGIDNRVVSNCSTHVFGKQSGPAAIEAVREIVAAKGGRADDVGRLLTGEFYFSTEGSGRPVRVRTPLCLTHHPTGPLTPDEVIARAATSSTVAARG